MIEQAVILAGGKGTRLKTRLGNVPKPLVEIDGKPLLARQIEHLVGFGVKDILLLVNHEAAQIEQFVSKLSFPHLRITVKDDGTPSGTAGAVLAAYESLADRFFVIYGDTLFNVDLDAMSRAHLECKPSATLLVHPNNHPSDSDIVEIDDGGLVTRFHAYPHAKDEWLPNLVNAAMYVVEKSPLEAHLCDAVPLDFGKYLFPALLAEGHRILSYPSFEYIKDIGTPERLDQATRDLQSGIVARASLRQPQRAVFVDRDGTINVHRGYIKDPTQLALLDGVGAAIKRLNREEYRVVIVTNQPVVARGEASFEELKRIHNKLETLLGEAGAFVDGIYVCPHHPDRGYQGEISALKFDCNCRKPKTGLLDRAAKGLNIDFARSWMIGDTARDILTARRAGIRSILVQTGEAGRDSDFAVTPDWTATNLMVAVDHILSNTGNGT